MIAQLEAICNQVLSQKEAAEVFLLHFEEAFDWIERTKSRYMRTLARLRNIIDPLDLAIGESFAQVHGPLDR